MKILILYFSGTGNTEYVGRYIKEHLSTEHKIEISPMEVFNKEDVAKYDTLYFGFPVYGGDLPDFIKEYIEDISLTTTKSVFVFTTKAFYSGLAMQHALNTFQKQGFISLGYANVNMPGSDGLAFMKKESLQARKMVEKDFSKLEEVDKLINRSKEIFNEIGKADIKQFSVKVRSSLINTLFSKILKAIFVIFEDRIEKNLYADDSCIRCSLCEQICPAGNIRVNEEGVTFGDECYHCLRCLHQCPQEAIQLGKRTRGKFRWKGPLSDYKPLKLK